MDGLTWVSRWMPLWIRLEPWTRYKAYTPLERGNINGLNDSWLKQDDTLVLSEIQGRVASCARHHRKRSAGWDLPRRMYEMVAECFGRGAGVISRWNSATAVVANFCIPRL